MEFLEKTSFNLLFFIKKLFLSKSKKSVLVAHIDRSLNKLDIKLIFEAFFGRKLKSVKILVVKKSKKRFACYKKAYLKLD